MSRDSEILAGLLALPPLPLIVEAAAAHPAPVLLVGGALRDALLGRPPADLDIAVGGDLPGFLDRFAAACGRRPVAIQDAWRDTHRTIVAGVQVDVALLLGAVEQDLGKRDFTINAMALPLGAADPRAGGNDGKRGEWEIAAPGPGRIDPEGLRQTSGVIDPFGGRRDLDARTIRALSAAALAEDPLRMLRAARYVATLDGFEIDAQSRSWIAAGVAAIEAVAGERIQSEWALLLAGRSWGTGVAAAYELGLGPRTLVAAGELQGVAAWEAHERGLGGTGGATEESGTSRFVEDRVTGRLAALLSDADLETPDNALLPRGQMAESLQTVLTGRRWPKAVARRAARIAAWAADLDGELAADTLVDRALADHAAAARAALLARARAEYRGGAAPKACETLELLARRAAEERWVSGAELRDWGVPQGPELGALLEELARGQLQRRWPTADAAREWARRRAESMAAPWRAAGT